MTMRASSRLLPVVLCGGAGSRLWPLSRETYPKQFLSLAGEWSMLQKTVQRLIEPLNGIDVATAPLLVCNTEHRFVTAEQLKAIGVGGAQILLEPVGRNTAPALTLAALQALEDSRSEDPVLLAMPADHMIEDVPAFRRAVQYAFPYAATGGVVTFGVEPNRPETGYGYICCAPVQQHSAHSTEIPAQVRLVNKFVEKPDVETARGYVDSGQYFWNSGIFMVRAGKWLEAVRACCPDIFDACSEAMRDAVKDLDFIRPSPSAFKACPSDSIDYAVMERLPLLTQLNIPTYVLPLVAGWSDLGAWDALWETLERDSDGNASVGQVIQHGCRNTLLYGSHRLVAGVGLEHIVVVETTDAVLVVDKYRTQEVKHIVAMLAGKGNGLAEHHRKVHRPWGWYDAIDSGPFFQVKRIVVNPGARLSLQLHRHRAEHWVVVSGNAEITNGTATFMLGRNESTFIPIGCPHRLANPGTMPLEIIEVQSGDYLGEDDIVRLDDIYGRSCRSEDDVSGSAF
ncbi:mannose-1-phosphate guanylyltransferase/mannose-6-phosphate isomerase [Paracidovorax avenae]|uniref:mannose-1-phosphate guanylyltransferase/mannose-6-phosphate isomerase n=1 Tax=Paracidovorax avenae TaxID=80867 RepID=UPI000D1616D9|nr:mannose-1-phosphate guanylyltransferase/mannose-6-phosphate isomerase [Paracidovorax avenae]AVT15468.1 mannose-1-phosphate guanylyltransferase/mannose-6-phosphate isomerase [Paracidovorax avenae]